VLIDVSQLSTDALLQTLQLTRVPVAATHSSARALIDNSRNLSDAELDAIKANGGVVQVTPFSAYVHKQDQAGLARTAAVRTRFGLSAEADTPYAGSEAFPEERRNAFIDALAAAQSHGTLGEFVDHIDYITRRIGWQHVGIGTDFDHGSGVTGFDSEADAPNVTAELVRCGYNEEQIAAIWGGNFLRVLRAAEAGRAK
jgi:membrane dipeptidase